MIVANSDLISRYPAQLYYSTLPFLPSETYLARRYPTPGGCISVVTGRENSWTPLLFTLPQHDYKRVAADVSPNGHMVAVYGGETGVIQIHNASNGLLNSSIRSIGSVMDDPSSYALTEDGSGVVVVVSPSVWVHEFSYQILKFNLVKQSGQICRITPRGDDPYPLKLSEYGSYVAFPDPKNRDARICIWKTDGGEDISIPLGCGGEFQDLALAGDLAHLVAFSTKDITFLSIPSAAVQRTLCH